MRLFLLSFLLLLATGAAAQTCVNPDQIDPTVACPAVIDPVCGCDGVTYQNSCEATFTGGVTAYVAGPCPDVADPGPGEPCASLPSDQLGDCDAVLGWGRVDGLCTSISGCSPFYDGDDWSDNLYPSLEDCAFACATPCVQPALIELGQMIDCTEEYAPVCGCDMVTYSNACHATYIGGVTSWEEGPCIVIEYGGCTYPLACNYDSGAAFDDGSCTFPPEDCYWPDTWATGCTYMDAVNYDENALVDDGSCFQDPCPLCFGDVNGDGYVGVADVLGVLSAFGSGC